MSRTPHVCQDDRVVNEQTCQCPEGSLQLQWVLETVLRKKQSRTDRVFADLEPTFVLTLTPNHPIFSRIPGPPGVASCNSLWFSGVLWAHNAVHGDHIWPACAWLSFHCVLVNSMTCVPGSPMSTLKGSQAGPSLACPASGPVRASCVQHLRKASIAIGQSPPQRQLSHSGFLAQSAYQPFSGVYFNVHKSAPTPWP